MKLLTTAQIVTVFCLFQATVLCQRLNYKEEFNVDGNFVNNLVGIDTEEKASSLPCKCGQSNYPKKIVGGTASKEHAWPWMAAIVNHQDGFIPTANCGGSIITNRHVLTAAHCLADFVKNGISSYRIYVGDNLINNGDTSTQKIVEIQSFKSHPRYNAKTLEFDVGIITLTTPLEFNKYILPICLGQSGFPFINQTAIVAGWGHTIFAGQGVNILRETSLTIMGNKNCSKYYMGTRTPITRNKLCAYYPDKGSCQGDSGGPLFVYKIRSVDIHKQVGIVSYGIGCADNAYPEVYTRVQSVLSWIKAVTKSGQYCKDSFS